MADLSRANPNVYYELGIAHSHRKNVILLAQNIDELPFDLRSYRNIPYGIPFDKMNEARQLFEKTIETMQAKKLTFGNPVTDFGHSVPDSLAYGAQSQATFDKQDDRGLIDYNIDFQDNMMVMTEVIKEMGERLNVLTADTESAISRIEGPEKHALRKQRKTWQSLAAKLEEFTVWLQDSNRNYQQGLVNAGQSVDAMLSGEFPITPEELAELHIFIRELENAEEAMIGLRSGCKDTITALATIPRVEKNFQRAKRLMSSETQIFIDNIDQTQSMIIRARNAAKRLLDENRSKDEGTL